MELNYEKMQKVIEDLEKRGFSVTVIACVDDEDITYTIKAVHPSGRTWKVIQIV